MCVPSSFAARKLAPFVLGCCSVVALGAAPPALPVPIVERWGTADGPRIEHPYSLTLSENGRFLAFVNRVPDKDRDLEVFDVRARKTILRTFLSKFPYQAYTFLLFTKDNKSIVVGECYSVSSNWSLQAKATVYELPSGRVLGNHVFPTNEGLWGVLSPDGKTLVVSSTNEAAVLYDTKTWKIVGRLKGDEKMPGVPINPEPGLARTGPSVHENFTTSLVLSPDGEWLAVATKGGWVSLWDVVNKRRLWRKQVDKRAVRHMAFSPDGFTLATLLDNRNYDLVFWRQRSGEAKMTVSRRCHHFFGFLPDGDIIFEKYTRVGFIRWSPRDDVYKGTLWGDWPEAWRLGVKRNDYYRYIASGGRMALSANGETLALICHSSEHGPRLVIYDLRTIWPKKP